MIRSFDFGNEPGRDELSSLVAKEVRRVLAQYDVAIKERSLTSAPTETDHCAGADLLSATRQKSIHDDLTDLASEFVQRLKAEASRRFGVSVHEANPLTAPTGGAISKKRDQLDNSMGLERWAGPVAGPTYLEEHFGIPRSTLHWWQRHNDVIALRKGARKHVFPLAQFIDGRPVSGIRQVLSLIANPRPAWFWLTSPSLRLGGRIPIEMLRHDLAEEVILAARDLSSTFDLTPN